MELVHGKRESGIKNLAIPMLFARIGVYCRAHFERGHRSVAVVAVHGGIVRDSPIRSQRTHHAHMIINRIVELMRSREVECRRIFLVKQIGTRIAIPVFRVTKHGGTEFQRAIPDK